MRKERSDSKYSLRDYMLDDGTYNVPCPECGKDRIKQRSNAGRALRSGTKCKSCGQRKPLSEHKPYKSLSPAWAKQVKEQYGNQCAVCGSEENLEAHHILSRIAWPQLAMNLSNGISLCSIHHKEHHALNGKKQFSV